MRPRIVYRFPEETGTRSRPLSVSVVCEKHGCAGRDRMGSLPTENVTGERTGLAE